jgi:hypothetical protein
MEDFSYGWLAPKIGTTFHSKNINIGTTLSLAVLFNNLAVPQASHTHGPNFGVSVPLLACGLNPEQASFTGKALELKKYSSIKV